jgi:hypothetical protein
VISKEASGSFLNERTKERLLKGGVGNAGANAPSRSKFFCFFLFTKRISFFDKKGQLI